MTLLGSRVTRRPTTPPETLRQHHHLQGHAEASYCCGKSLIKSALVRVSTREQNPFPNVLLQPLGDPPPFEFMHCSEYLETADNSTRDAVSRRGCETTMGTTRANGAPKFCRRFSRVCPNFVGSHRKKCPVFGRFVEGGGLKNRRLRQCTSRFAKC